MERYFPAMELDQITKVHSFNAQNVYGFFLKAHKGLKMPSITLKKNYQSKISTPNQVFRNFSPNPQHFKQLKKKRKKRLKVKNHRSNSLPKKTEEIVREGEGFVKNTCHMARFY